MSNNAAVSRDLQQEIEQFLYWEAHLLDEGLFDEWLELFTQDATYWMPTRQTRARGEDGVQHIGGVSLFEDDKNFLTMRVKRFDTGLAHAEEPPSRTRHFVSNVRISSIAADHLEVACNVIVYQSRLERQESYFVGYRTDRMRRVDGEWRIASRKIVLDQTLLPRSLSIFF